MQRDERPPARISRRGFLVALAGTAIAASRLRADASPQPPSARPAPPALRLDVAPEPAWQSPPSRQSLLTETERLFVAQYHPRRTPHLDAATWRLTVDGLVARPMALTLDAIRALPAMHDTRVLACISNPAGGALVGNVKVSGADAAYLWPRLDIQPNATHARLEAADGYSTGVTLETLTQPGVMLAYAMNDAPLTIEHGYPLRVLIPGLYGQKMPRWITRLTFLDEPYLGFWERRGYSDAAAMLTTSMIHSPHDGSELPANTPIHLQGVAYGGKRSITHVEVQIDDGGWLEAQIITPSSPLAWTTWHLDWRTPARGQVRIGVRATDAAGFTQTEDADHRLSAGPHGTNAIHRITVYVS